MENTPDNEKLPDLVCNTEQQETLNAVMDTTKATTPAQTTNVADEEFNGIMDTPSIATVTPVTPENTPGMLLVNLPNNNENNTSV